jgi:hypothetical protein
VADPDADPDPHAAAHADSHPHADACANAGRDAHAHPDPDHRGHIQRRCDADAAGRTLARAGGGPDAVAGPVGRGEHAGLGRAIPVDDARARPPSAG